ncbi:MAG: beta-galactosidase [Candidatus Acidiferrales bacterium]
MRRNRWRGLPVALAIACAAAFSGAAPRHPPATIPLQAQIPSQAETAGAPAAGGLEIVENGGYPELRVDGKPFFIHSAAFFYYRIPVDQWEHLLQVYRSYGINTIDLYIPWNWHEPKEGEIDFDGRTNPRRNLRALLALIESANLRLIARPGPEILNEWQYGGYPGWLLERPEYKMDPIDWIEGRYAPLDNLNASDAEAAAEGWLANPTHMEKAREWLAAVAKELAKYSARRVVHFEKDEKTAARDVSGPLLFVQLGDDFAIGRSNGVGPNFWRYVESLRGAVEAGGVTVPVFINPTDMRVSASGSDRERPIGVMGQWYLERRPENAGGVRRFTASDAAEVEFFTEELKTQPAFPPVMIEYQAGWYTPGDDDGPMASPPENTLLSSRLLIANGIHGINYFPLHDTYSPAGYSVPWANRSYRWDAALAPDGEQQPRMHAVIRNMEILQRWGPQLAASHKRADFGIIYPMGTYPQELLEGLDISTVSTTVMRIERLSATAMLSSELLDAEYQPTEQLSRNAVTLLPVFDPGKPQFQMSEKAQGAIVEYVRRGGTLVVFPQRPRGSVIDALWKNAREGEANDASDLKSAIRARWKFGEGEVIFSSKDFYSWIALERALPEIRGEREADWAAGVLRGFLQAAGVRPSVKSSGTPSQPSDLLVNEIVSNEGTEELGARKSGRGFVSVTNLSASDTAEESFEILSTAAPARGSDVAYIPLHVTVPPRESLLLPLEEPVCFADPGNAPCGDSVTTGSAEFLDARREGKTLDLLLYAPTRAEIRIRLPQKPLRLSLDDNHIEGEWDPDGHELHVKILRGMAPQFIRVLSLELARKPNVEEREKPVKPSLGEIDYFVANAVRLPTGADTGMRTYPPLVIAGKNRGFVVVMQADQQTGVPNLSLDISVSGPLRGSGVLRLLPRGVAVEKVALKPAQNELMALPPSTDGLLHGTVEIKMGHERRALPVAFLQPREDGLYRYRYDFDRDGADEWVLENSNLRLIVSPESGGRALALVDKTSGQNLATSVGLLRDGFSFTANPAGADEARARGRHGLFNRPYAAEWIGEQKNTILKLRYDAPDVLPGGASIEKAIRFEGPSEVRAEYSVALKDASPGTGGMEKRAQSFVVVNSFPATARPGRQTTFCWPAEGGVEQSAASDQKQRAKGGWHCEDFKPGGEPVEVPSGAKRVEVRTTGRAATTLEWDCAAECGRMTIEPKHFSGLFRLEFPKLTPGADATHYTIHIRASERE